MKSWRDVLPIHPAADLFPLMSEAELRELGEDIKTKGLKSPIVLWSPEAKGRRLPKQVYLLDGRNRLAAMELVGLDTVDGDSLDIEATVAAAADAVGDHCIRRLYGHVDPYSYVLSANIHRRHLTAEQRRELVAKIIAANPGKSDRTIAEETKTPRTTVQRIRKATTGGPNGPREGKDGKTYKQPTKRKPAVQEVFDSPQEAHGKGDGVLGKNADDGEGDSKQEQWRLSLSNMAGEAVSLPAYWKRLFGDWAGFDAPSDLVVLAEEAAETWKHIATKLKEKADVDGVAKSKEAHSGGDLEIPECLRRAKAATSL